MHSPFRYTILQGVARGRNALGTTFLPLKEFVEAQPSEVRQTWEGLWMQTSAGTRHPLVYRHPGSDEPTMALHMHENLASAFFGPDSQIHKSIAEMFHDLGNAIDATGLPLTIDWEAGDVIIVDNIAVAHRAPDEKNDDGLRILDHLDVYDDSMLPTAALTYEAAKRSSSNHSEVPTLLKVLPDLDMQWDAEGTLKGVGSTGLLARNLDLFYGFYTSGDPCSCPIAMPAEIKCPAGMTCVTVSHNETLKGHLNATRNHTVIAHCCQQVSSTRSPALRKSR